MRHFLIGVAAVAAQFGVAFAAEGDICPASLATTQSGKAPYPYTLKNGTASAPLMGVTFFDGDPKEEASLAPDSTKTAGGKMTSVWTFDPAGKNGTYVSCSYFGTSMTLERKLNPAPSKCTVTYDAKSTTGGLPTILSIACS
jgi:hypothetical protein